LTSRFAGAAAVGRVAAQDGGCPDPDSPSVRLVEASAAELQG